MKKSIRKSLLFVHVVVVRLLIGIQVGVGVSILKATHGVNIIKLIIHPLVLVAAGNPLHGKKVVVGISMYWDIADVANLCQKSINRKLVSLLERVMPVSANVISKQPQDVESTPLTNIVKLGRVWWSGSRVVNVVQQKECMHIMKFPVMIKRSFQCAANAIPQNMQLQEQKDTTHLLEQWLLYVHADVDSQSNGSVCVGGQNIVKVMAAPKCQQAPALKNLRCAHVGVERRSSFDTEKVGINISVGMVNGWRGITPQRGEQ
jgi:flagellar biosynthesis protein FliQ